MGALLRVISFFYYAATLSYCLRMPVKSDLVIGALYGFYVGDSLAMPVHWYYDLNQLRNDFGKITKYEAPKV